MFFKKKETEPVHEQQKVDDNLIQESTDEVLEEGLAKDFMTAMGRNPEAAVTLGVGVLYVASRLKNAYDESEVKKRIDHWAEDVYNGIFARVSINERDKTLTIKGIDYDKLLVRLKEAFSEKQVASNFEFNYSLYTTLMYNLRVIKGKERSKTAITMPLFFALEMQILFEILGERYDFDYYRYLSKALVEKTWVRKMLDKRSSAQPAQLAKVNQELVFTLKGYQAEFIEQYPVLKDSQGLEGYILSFEQGLGKTLTACALASALDKDCVVITCPNTIRENWAMEIKNYFKKYADNDQLFREEVYVTNAKGYQVTPKTKYFIVNHESIPLVYKYMSPSKDTMIIVDEMHFFRNMKGSRVAELLKLKELSKAKDCLLMSGTPIKQAPQEIIPALLMIDPMFTQEAAVIYNRLFNVDTTSMSKIVNRRFGLIIYRKLKTDVLQLPPKNELTLSLQLPNYEDYLIENVSAEIGGVYDQIYNEMRTQVSELQARYLQYVDHFQSANILDKNLYRSYITNEVSKEKRKERHELSEKFFIEYNEKYVLPNIQSQDLKKEFIDLTKKFLDMRKSAMAQAIGRVLPPKRTEMFQSLITHNIDAIIANVRSAKKKTIIFSTMLGVVDTAYDELTKAGIKCLKVVGETKNRQEIFDKFRADDEYEVLVATQQTLSTGVTLTIANNVIFAGAPWRKSDYLQASDRVHRLSQTDEVNVWNIILNSQKPNLSTRMMDILNKSAEMADAFIDGIVSDKFV